MNPSTCSVCQEIFDDAAPGPEENPYKENNFWKLHYHTIAQHPETLFACPQSHGSRFGSGKEHFWKDGNMSYSTGRSCSYCGSLPVKDFFDAVNAGAVVTPTDKNYKVYVQGAGLENAKFYFQHLTEEDQAIFIQLVNTKVMKMGYPGYFYVMPFFCAVRTDP